MDAEESVGGARLLTFRVGRGRFAVPVESVFGVRETAAEDAEAVPGSRGRRARGIDARARWWGGAGAAVGRRPAVELLVGASREEAVTLVVDGVEGIVEDAAVQPLPALVARFVHGVFRGVAQHAGGILVVDPAVLAGTAVKSGASGGRGGPEKG